MSMSKVKVLIIEDNPVIIRMNEKLLGSQGYDVITARDGAEGIERAVKERPDVILLDIILPVMHGFEVCKELRKDPATEKIPIIIVTGTGLEEVAQHESAVDAQGYIAKPYDFRTIDALIKKVLNKQ